MRDDAPRLGAWALVASLALVGCAAADGGPPGPASHGVAGTPVGRSAHPRSGQFSYRLGRVERDGAGVRVDLRLTNGTSQHYQSVGLRVRVHGDDGQTREVLIPLGPHAAGRTRPVSARLPDVPFAVRDVSLELTHAVP